MKRFLLFLVSIMTLLSFGSAYADSRVYYLSLGVGESGTTNAAKAFTSGNTTVASGTSSLVLWGGGLNRDQNRTILNSKELPAGYWIAEVSAVTPSQVQQALGGNQSGVSYVFGFRQSVTGNLSKAEKRPIAINTIGSSTSSYQVPLFLDPAVSTQFYAETGVTPLDGLNVTLFRPDGQADWKVEPILLSTLVFLGPTTSGGSSFASADSNGVVMPDGTRRLEAMATDSGVSVIYSASTPNSAGRSQHIPGEVEKTLTGSLQTLKNYTIRILGAGNAVIECWSRKE